MIKKIIISTLILVILPPSVLANEASFLDKVSATVESLVTLKKELNKRYELYLNTKGTVTTAKKKLEPVRLKINSLSGQLATMDENIRRAEANIESTQRETAGVQVELADLFELVKTREVDLTRARRLLDEFIRLAYTETMRYTDWQTGEISTLKFLLAGGQLANAEMQQKNLTILQLTTQRLVDRLQLAEQRYESTRSDLLVRRGKLLSYQKELLNRREDLTDLRAGKERLLRDTQGKEREYQRLIKDARDEQTAVLSDIIELKDNLGVINEKLVQLRDQTGLKKFKKLLKEQGLANVSGLTFPGHTPRLIWPADPSRGITTHYLDPEYELIFGVPHYAIDFRQRQGSEVRAAAPGVVYKVVNNGFRYSYVMLAHANELQTIYGHLSRILVREGQTVEAGEVIGLSGGTPGSRGAGLMTTGPHIHFEVFDHGEHVDPLDYLPLEELRAEDVPKKYLKQN